MSNPKFPNAKPRQMNGMASLMAQARDLPSVAQQRQKIATGILRDAHGIGAAEKEAMTALHELLHRLDTAEHRVQLVTEVIAQFRLQCNKLPADDPVRMTAERMLGTFEQCAQAQARTQLTEEPNEADASGTSTG